MDVDQALTSAGALGRVQVLVTIAACLTQIQVAWIAISTVFISETPHHHCASSPGFVLNTSNPFHESNHESNYGECEEYVKGNSTRPCGNGWEYDTELTGKSIVSDWDLVCSRDYLPDLSQSIIVVGFAMGVLSAGPLADRFGRRPTQIISLALFIIFGLAVSLSPNYIVYVSLRFAVGAAIMIHKIPISTLQCEFMIPKHRSIMGSIPFIMSALGTIAMSGIAYYVRDWRFFNVAIMSPAIVLISFLWIIPESVRWIMSKGDVIQAEKTMKQVAKLNRARTYRGPVFINQLEVEENNSFVNTSSKQHIQNGNKKTTNLKKKGTIQSMREIFKQPTATVTCILGLCWTVNLLTYFGFALSVGTLAGNIYLNFFLIALVELPARTMSLIVVKKTGSLLLVIFSYATSGLSMLVIVLLSFATAESSLSSWWLTSVALLGKFFVSLSMAPLNLLMNELFPTSVRNSGRGVAQLVGNVGSLLVPFLLYMVFKRIVLAFVFVNMLFQVPCGFSLCVLTKMSHVNTLSLTKQIDDCGEDKFVPNLTFMAISVSTLLCAGLCLLLPETLNTTQPDTREDLQVLFDTKRIIRCGNRSQRIPDSEI